MAINVLTPIETRYNGILFRSRIEARWAVFFDKIRVPYQYEAEGYDLNGVWYLPDFWMPQQDCFIEIKGVKPDIEAEKKASLLARLSRKRVFIFFEGIPTIEEYGLMSSTDGAYLYDSSSDDSGEVFPGWDNGHLWCQCKFCGKYDIQFNGRSFRIDCCSVNKDVHSGKIPINENSDKGYNSATDSLVSAYNAARSARFGT